MASVPDDLATLMDDLESRSPSTSVLLKDTLDEDSDPVEYGPFTYHVSAAHANSHTIQYGDATVSLPVHPSQSRQRTYVLEALAAGIPCEDAVDHVYEQDIDDIMRYDTGGIGSLNSELGPDGTLPGDEQEHLTALLETEIWGREYQE